MERSFVTENYEKESQRSTSILEVNSQKSVSNFSASVRNWQSQAQTKVSEYQNLFKYRKVNTKKMN